MKFYWELVTGVPSEPEQSIPVCLGFCVWGEGKRESRVSLMGMNNKMCTNPESSDTHRGVLKLSEETEQVLGKDVSAPHLENTVKIPHTRERRLEQSSLIPSLAMWIRSRTCRISLLCFLGAVVRALLDPVWPIAPWNSSHHVIQIPNVRLTCCCNRKQAKTCH